MSGVSDALQNRFVVFYLDEQRYALPLHMVDSVVRMVEITELPGLPRYIQGVVNVHGTIMAVINMRRRMELKERSEALSDQLIVARSQERSFAIMVDGVSEVLSADGATTGGDTVAPTDTGFLTGIVKMPDGMILLNNPDALLVTGDQERIDAILGRVKL